ncbi:hypothetical protein ColLi_08010 [Colletotrichum liriopes]|uniref:Uncharacterized protein n=1 Tax=Colletotrichum liriopes TaxID=708192 RepID=A0AA37GRG0_9PEZI|nr:hypothetical protein ColLi_08010 [Colletotrichum liriopes]
MIPRVVLRWLRAACHACMHGPWMMGREGRRGEGPGSTHCPVSQNAAHAANAANAARAANGIVRA